MALRIEDFAPDAFLDEMAIEDPFGLTGLYDGIPLTEKSVMDQPHGPDTIWLFRRPILDEWVDRGNVTLGASSRMFASMNSPIISGGPTPTSP